MRYPSRCVIKNGVIVIRIDVIVIIFDDNGKSRNILQNIFTEYFLRKLDKTL